MEKVFIIAEGGDNHNGDCGLAKQLVDVALEAQADAVKFQTFITEEIVTKQAPMAQYQKEAMNDDESSQWDLIKGLELSFDAFREIKAYCDKVGIMFMTTPFDFPSADFVDTLVGRHKMPSGEITNFPFIAKIAKMGKPIILSTGMSTLDEVEQAIQVVQEYQPEIDGEIAPLALLHCTSNYPTAYSDVHLNAMQTMRDAFGLPVGYSDHTLGIEVSVAAVAMGATIIEKHFTLDRTMDGPDHQASLEPTELCDLVRSIRNVEKAMGSAKKEPAASELEVQAIARRSLIIKCALEKGTVLAPEMFTFKRPGTGISPKDLTQVCGMVLQCDKGADELLAWEDVKHA